LAELEGSKQVKQALKAEREAIERQRQSFHEAVMNLDTARDDPEKRPAALSEVRSLMGNLRSDIRKSPNENAPQTIPLRRTLLHILSQSIEMGQQAIRNKEYALAITYFDLAIEYARAAPLAHFEKARALALAGRDKDVLPALRKAVETGFADAGMIETAPEFSALKEQPDFRDIVQMARKER
jgi:hypothetical protein